MKSEEVKWNWTFVSQCIDSPSDSPELLWEIVTPCVTNQGFSIAASWMETYKVACEKNDKQSGLNKGLKKSSDNYSICRTQLNSALLLTCCRYICNN